MANLFPKRIIVCLILIFFAANTIRFLFFPNNVQFSFDQARDSFTALEILNGNLKLIGPPSFLNDKLFPGPLIFYLYAPIYFLFDKNPEAASAFFRIWNSFGVLLVYTIGAILFNKRSGLIAAIFFAFSYEQSQYSIFLSHQPLAVISVLLFYLGLCIYLFLKKPWGMVITAAGLGLSMQFHYGYAFLIVSFFTFLVFFRKYFCGHQTKWIIISLLSFFLTVSTYLLSEFKYHFIYNLIFQSNTLSKTQFLSGIHIKETIFVVNRFLYDSFIANYQLTPSLGLIFLIATFYLIFGKQQKDRIIFLCIWFAFGLSLYLFSGVPSYYYGAAASVSLLLFCSYFIDKLFHFSKVLSILIILAIISNNLFLVFSNNSKGVNKDMVIQPGMLTSSQKQVLDYIYINSQNKPFAVGALTIPLNINTTWSYLFEWYGVNKYGYLPYWIGPVASGYAGNIKIINARSQLPKKQFLIVEPTIGIKENEIERFFREEAYFTKIIEERKFGTITVQQRQPY